MNHGQMLVCCGVLLWSCGSPASADQESATAEIEKSGGTVRLIAQDSDQQEADFHLSGKDLTDDGLSPLKEISNLTWLNLANTKITGEGLKHLADINTLTRLHLENTAVGDEGLSHLAGLENLEYLNLYGTKVTDAGLDHLKGLENLKKLYLWQSQATEAGAKKLQESLPNLVVNLGADFSKVIVQEAEPTKPLAKGQYVRVRLEGDSQILSLAEVQVFEFGTGEEIQQSGKSRQSSVDYEGDAARAHDGNAEQVYEKGSVSHTKQEKDPWWVLDLGDEKEIGQIKVFNRGDCCGDRLNEATVDVLGASLLVVWSEKIDEATDASVAEFVSATEGEERSETSEERSEE